MNQQVNQIRQQFLAFFKSYGHEVVKSSSLIPLDDPTLLFTNAGMNQFKDVFLGLDKRNYVRATSAQKCVRSGGKHNDLENVGYTARHHTFFEMLGNFSFGDYFKLDAIKYAWEFLTSPQWLNLPKQKLYVTVYHTDDEAFKIWHEVIGLGLDRIIRIGDNPDGGSDNFWQMADTGPCGPSSEIFYDHGCDIPGGLPGTANQEGDRYIEIWNCVFMQFDRDEHGILHNLPKPSVDTGMGLERIAAVMQKVHSNYEIDIFVSLINCAAKITGCSDMAHPSLKVLADHIRAVGFLIADGVVPSNEGRGYVLRRIIRRAIRHGYKLGLRIPFFHKLVDELVTQMGGSYPELIQQSVLIKDLIVTEEERFFQTIDHGMKLLENELSRLNSLAKETSLAVNGNYTATNIQDNRNILPGITAFKLYDTYGFPLDLTQDICREYSKSVAVDGEFGFEYYMQQQKTTAKLAMTFKRAATVNYLGEETNFIGDTESSVVTKVSALYQDNSPVGILKAGDSGIVVLEQSVFYAEGGGQVGDSGVIQIDGGARLLFAVTDTQKIRPLVFGHIGSVTTGEIKLGDTVVASFDLHKRLATARNHSATHLLHKALHEVLGAHATQKGSLVNNESIRFDFSHNKALAQTQIAEIERLVNHVIMLNYPVQITSMRYADALNSGAMALFGEKYTGDVRVIQMGEFSSELCGGTHVRRTGDIGFFAITNELAVASGIRRIEAITGEVALLQMQKNMLILDNLRHALKAQSNDIIFTKLLALQEENKQSNQKINELNSKLALSMTHQMADTVELLSNGDKLIVAELDNTDNKSILELMDKLKSKLVSGIVVIGYINQNQANLVVGVTQDKTPKYNAGVIVKHLATIMNGRGGGKAELAQAGGGDVAKLGAALDLAKAFLESF